MKGKKRVETLQEFVARVGRGRPKIQGKKIRFSWDREKGK